MDPDSEFNALAAVYQSVVSDMKHSYSAWETVGQKAVKLSTALRTATVALQGFVDAIQSVSDLANNLKGASRDVGACVTRVCMRERALETRLRSVADALSDQVAVTIQQRTGYWKSRTNELDKLSSKHVKKVRSRKTRPDSVCVTEQRQLCTQALLEQRQQFTFFVQALMPFMTEEVGLLEEGSHIRQVVDQMDSTIKHVDSGMLVHTILSDLTQSAEQAWRQCLGTASRSFHNGSEDPSPTRSYASDMTGDTDTPVVHRQIQTIGAGPLGHAPLTSLTFTPMGPKPPLSRRPSSHSVITKDTPPPDIPCTFRNSQMDMSVNGGNGTVRQRPQSFAGGGGGDGRGGHYATVHPHNQHHQMMTSFGGQNTNGGGNTGGSSSCSSSDAASSAALIAETLHQIDQLGSDLENYCSAQEKKEGGGGHHDKHSSLNTSIPVSLSSSHGTEYSLPRPTQLPPPAYNNAIRMRNEGSRPPPPERRSSQITAATPTAPSVAEARMNMIGSRQSLTSINGSGYGTLNSSTQDVRFSNVNPYSQGKYPPF